MKTFVWSGFSQGLRQAYVVVQADSEEAAGMKVFDYILKLNGDNSASARREYEQFGFVAPYILGENDAPLIMPNGEEDD